MELIQTLGRELAIVMENCIHRSVWERDHPEAMAALRETREVLLAAEMIVPEPVEKVLSYSFTQ